MAKSLSVLFVTPEIYPFSKESGVSDFCFSLSLALREIGNDVRVAMPKYGIISERKNKIHDINRLRNIEIPIGDTTYPATVKSSSINNPRSKSQAYITTNHKYFDSRKGIYHDMVDWKEYPDNAERFIYFCRSIIETIVILNWFPDIIHCHDWQTAAFAAMAKNLYPKQFKKTKFVFTFHNLTKQGVFPLNTFDLMGIDKSQLDNFTHKKQFNFLKAGMIYSDAITTVSKEYSEDLLKDKELHNGLDKFIKEKGDMFVGIPTGIDQWIWNAARDETIKTNFDGDFENYKYDNKVELINRFELEYSPKTPLFAMVSRINTQKGINFIIDSADEIFKEDLQLVFLGQGDSELKEKLSKISEKYPNKFKVKFTFDDSLAHLMEAGSDMFLIPSDYEPCALNFMYSLKYGSLPVAHLSGRINSLGIDYFKDQENGNSILFEKWDAESMLEAIKKGLELYKNKEEWNKLTSNLLDTNLSWGENAKKYDEIYRKLM